MTGFDATLSSDVYKVFHPSATHPDIIGTYSNFTNRSGKYSNIKNNDKVVNIGWQYLIKKHLIGRWNDTFFNVPKEQAIGKYKIVTKSVLGHEVDTSHLERLHNLGYLPLEIKSYPEGMLIPYGVASATFKTTVAGFDWLIGMLETVISQEVWPIQTSCTTALAYLRKQGEFFKATGGPMELLPFMIHDFSARGTFGEEASAMSGFGHLASGCIGSDTLAAGMFAEKYYNANWETDLIMASVNATEHSVTCGWLEEGEYEYFKHLMTNVAPTGILSVVSDTWDFWHTVTTIVVELKETIMNRDGKLVFRPDSGDPVKILTGYTEEELCRFDGKTYARLNGNHKIPATEFIKKQYQDQQQLKECEVKGLVEVLWDTFGGTWTSVMRRDKGGNTEEHYKMLDEHIGAIYGDSITLERQQQIGERLIAKGFVPQVVLGVGSYSYQGVTRDTHGSAIKATNVTKVDHKACVENYSQGFTYEQAIFKDPKTDSKKKSAKGYLRVERENGELVQYDNQKYSQTLEGELHTIFIDGVLIQEESLEGIRNVIASQTKINDLETGNRVSPHNQK